MRVLVGCEYSGRVRDAFRSRGHDAWSCDLLDCEGDPKYHIKGDILALLGDGWDLMVAHPPCTRLCNSGVAWLAKRDLWGDMREGAAFFKALYNAPIPKVAIENPIQHKYAIEAHGCGKASQIIQPWMFGHGETKATCLWLRGLPLLAATNLVSGREQRLHRLPPSPDRWKERSRTYQGIANAMAEQWG